MNRVLLTGRLTRDPELRTTAGGKSVAQFSVASLGAGHVAETTGPGTQRGYGPVPGCCCRPAPRHVR